MSRPVSERFLVRHMLSMKTIGHLLERKGMGRVLMSTTPRTVGMQTPGPLHTRMSVFCFFFNGCGRVILCFSRDGRVCAFVWVCKRKSETERVSEWVRKPHLVVCASLLSATPSDHILASLPSPDRMLSPSLSLSPYCMLSPPLSLSPYCICYHHHYHSHLVVCASLATKPGGSPREWSLH